MGSKLFFSLDSIKPQKSYEGGTITSVTSKEVPGFANISFKLLKLNKRGSLEPVWHPNANKIGYCLQGKTLVSVRSPSSVDVFTAEHGDVFFIPKGYVHHIENIGEEQSIIAFALNNVDPEVMCLSNAVYSISSSVFSATFNTLPDFYEGLTKSKKQDLIKTLPVQKKAPGTMPVAINLTLKRAQNLSRQKAAISN